MHPAGFIYDIIARAGGIAELAFCHRYDVRAPLPAERLRDRLLPDGRGLQIGLRVGVAAEAVRVLRLFADQPRLIARVGVDVGRDLRLVLRLALLERAISSYCVWQQSSVCVCSSLSACPQTRTRRAA